MSWRPIIRSNRTGSQIAIQFFNFVSKFSLLIFRLRVLMEGVFKSSLAVDLSQLTEAIRRLVETGTCTCLHANIKLKFSADDKNKMN